MKIGDEVKLYADHSTKATIYGAVTKVNKRTIIFKCEFGRLYKVLKTEVELLK